MTEIKIGDKTWTYARTPSRTYARTPSRTYARTPSRTYARTPSRTYTRTPSRTYTRTPSRTYARTPSRTYTRTPSRTYTRTPSRFYRCQLCSPPNRLVYSVFGWQVEVFCKGPEIIIEGGRVENRQRDATLINALPLSPN